MKDAGLENLSTARLRLRRFTPDDYEFLVALYSDIEVVRYTGGVKTRAQSQEMLDNFILAYYEKNPGLGIWLTLDKFTGEPLGMHLLNHMRGETLIQLGYSLMRPHWGRGYATEMGKAILHYAFRDLGLPRVHGITDPRNLDSQHVLLKCGLARKGERIIPAYSETQAQAFFERDAAEWLAEHGVPGESGHGIDQAHG